MVARSIRNNNPGNIRVGAPWQGLASLEQRTPEQKSEKAFCVFLEPKYGFRAMIKLLSNYKKLYGRDTLEQIVHTWAPAEDRNDPNSYIGRVSRLTGIKPKVAIDVMDYDIARPLVEAMARVEAGLTDNEAFPWTDKEIDEGLAMAGVKVPDHAPPSTPEESESQLRESLVALRDQLETALSGVNKALSRFEG